MSILGTAYANERPKPGGIAGCLVSGVSAGRLDGGFGPERVVRDRFRTVSSWLLPTMGVIGEMGVRNKEKWRDFRVRGAVRGGWRVARDAGIGRMGPIGPMHA